MRLLALLLLTCFKFSKISGQENKSVFFESENSYYHSTDFSKTDSLAEWFYVLLDKNLSYEDSIQPIGQLIFQRSKKINEWMPNFTFQIFNIKDSSYCFKKSQLVRALSDCIPPNVPGDIIIFNQFIFLNTNICLKGKSVQGRIDYCRPLINKVFSVVDKTRVVTIDELVEQFPIKGQIIKLPF